MKMTWLQFFGLFSAHVYGRSQLAATTSYVVHAKSSFRSHIKRQTLAEINVYERLFGTLEYVGPEAMQVKYLYR